MLTTTHQEILQTQNFGDPNATQSDNELLSRYREITGERRHNWTSHHRLIKLLGRGGQGLVFLSERRGADDFTLPVAVKMFSPERFESSRAYDEAMGRIARVAARVAQIQQDNLLDVQDFVDRHRIRLMVMGWVDGYDLSRLLDNKLLDRVRTNFSNKRWDHISQVVLTYGPAQPRIKPGVAVAIVRDCLAALAALHRNRIVHGDIKPSNIMLKRTGTAKIVDIGSAVEMDDPPAGRTITPTYAAPEVLDGGQLTERSDLASLGYVLVEMLSGRQPFAGLTTVSELLEAKRFLAQRLPQILPHDVVCNEVLMNLCRGLVAPDPSRRFPSAEHADFTPNSGAVAFHRQLVKGDLASEYDNEIRVWLGTLKDLEEFADDNDPTQPV